MTSGYRQQTQSNPCLTGSQKVVGSSPIGSTKYGAGFQGWEARRFLLSRPNRVHLAFSTECSGC